MLSRIFKNYDYERVVSKLSPFALVAGAGLGSVYGSYLWTHPRNGDVRFRDALFGGIMGGAMGIVASSVVMALHPLIILAIPGALPYLYNRYQQHKMDGQMFTVKR